MKKKLLITGGSGFLGQLLLPHLSPNYEVYYTGILDQAGTPAYFQLDIADAPAVNKLIAEIKPHYIIHAAGIKSIVEAQENPLKCIEVNIQGSNNIARAAINNKVDFVLGISSTKAGLGGQNLYSLSKMAMEQLFVSLTSNTTFACFRLGNILWAPGSFLWLWKKSWDATQTIETTGFEMKRFLCSKQQVVDDILTLLNNKNSVSKQIVTAKLGYAKIGDMLDIWTSELGGKYVKVDPRPGDVIEDVLVAEHEKAFTEIVKFEEKPYFMYSPGKAVKNNLFEAINTQNQPAMPKNKLKAIILEPFK